MPQQLTVSLLRQQQVSPDYSLMTCAWPGRPPRPGQFFTVKSPRPDGTLLRRPLAAAGWRSSGDTELGEVDFLYQLRGPATRGYAKERPGQNLSLLGPLGRGFSIPEAPPSPAGRPAVLVGGGIGTGPMLYTAQAQPGRPLLILGFRSAGLIPRSALSRIRETNAAEIVLCTDDGSEGFRGTAADCLNSRFSAESAPRLIQACGPYPMLRAVHLWCEARDIPLEVSLEAMMACGVGACAGCAVEAAGSTPEAPVYRKVCSDGPVFSSREILWG